MSFVCLSPHARQQNFARRRQDGRGPRTGDRRPGAEAGTPPRRPRRYAPGLRPPTPAAHAGRRPARVIARF